MSTLLSPRLWLECSILLAMFGGLCVSPIRNPLRAWRWGLVLTGGTFFCTLLACTVFYLRVPNTAETTASLQTSVLGRQFLNVDELNAPLLSVVGLLHFLTALATGRTKMRRFSLSWSLASEAARLATFGCTNPSALIALLAVGTGPAYVELVNRGKSTRVYTLHMALYLALLGLGWLFINPGAGYREHTAWATVPLLAAILIQCGTVPAHCWVIDWIENASFGNAILFVTPLVGVYAAVRLVLPIAPDWVLRSIGIFSVITALYASGMAVIQRKARRFFGYLFLSHASLVLVGLELNTSVSLTGALALWISVSLSLAAFGLTLRAIEARFGRLNLVEFRGLYDHCPMLAVCFLLSGLGSVGFPGTLGFVGSELLVDGAVEVNPYVGLAVVIVAALNGIAVLRAYFLLFTGTRHASTVSLTIGPRERVAVLTLTALILGGGISPQPGVTSRHRAAIAIIHDREQRNQRSRPEDADLAASLKPDARN